MNSPAKPGAIGAILCGGRASRLGGDKAQVELAGKSLLNRVIDRFESQVNRIVLSTQTDQQLTDARRYRCIPDAIASHRGPLIGLYTALHSLADDPEEWLALCPCDAPFLPSDLVRRLHNAVKLEGKPVAVARYGGVVQPTFSLWHRDVTQAIGAVVLEQGKGGLMTMLDLLEHAIVDWEESEAAPFFNINTPAELDQARRLLDAGASGT